MEFTLNLDQLRRILAWALEEIKAHGLTGHGLKQMELALEEALVNIFSHGYLQKEGRVEIEVKKTSSDTVSVILKDFAPSFDPTKKGPADCTSPLDKRETGGLGIHFIKESTDSMSYQRVGNANILTLMKKMDLSKGF